jgi:hypothetical protein
MCRTPSGSNPTTQNGVCGYPGCHVVCRNPINAISGPQRLPGLISDFGSMPLLRSEVDQGHRA